MLHYLLTAGENMQSYPVASPGLSLPVDPQKQLQLLLGMGLAGKAPQGAAAAQAKQVSKVAKINR